MPVRVRQRSSSQRGPGRPVASTSALVPAAARAPESLSAVEAVLNGEAVEMFAKAVGGRPKLAEVLAVTATATEIDKVATYLLDPKYDGYTLRNLCTLAGITVADLFAAYKKALIARAHIESTHIIASRLPPIVEDVMARALSDPTVDRQKLALELGQLIEKKGGILVQQNNQVAATSFAATGAGALEQLHQAVGDLLFSPKRHRRSEPIDPLDIDRADRGLHEPPVEDPREPPWPAEDEPPLPFGDPEPEPDSAA